MKKYELTDIQLKAITFILNYSSIDKAAKKAGISRSTIYKWLKDDIFRERLEEERKNIFEEGLNSIKAATLKATHTLIKLLYSEDENTRRLAAKEILNMGFKAVEILELEERIGKLEELLEQSKKGK
ncbi:MAG: phBC6A51 family helix-turn-helix protein [Candidatus Aminicenantaceae bacterium]